MVHINTDGKFNDNSYLIDGLMFSLPGNNTVYIIENEGERLMIDTSTPLQSRKIIKKMKEFGIFPIHKLLFTHSHFDHNQAWEKLKRSFGELEIFASKNAVENLKHPEIMNDVYGFKVPPLEEFTQLKEGDVIDLNGLELKILDFFGHTNDSIAVLDEKNKNIFVGDAIMSKNDINTPSPNVIMPPDFNESNLIQTFEKLRKISNNLNSISLGHCGVYKDEDFKKIVEEMEDFYFKTKNALIQWYNENPTSEYLAEKYHETFIPNSTIHTEGNLLRLIIPMEWLIEGLKGCGFVT
jgi:glyoxylase-like metal-dependent hydrolase (beta-lactamase superfamily II)